MSREKRQNDFERVLSRLFINNSFTFPVFFAKIQAYYQRHAMKVDIKPYRSTNWEIILFFLVTAGVGLIGTPFYIYHYGITASEIFLFFFFMAVTGAGITVGYHRHFSHATFKAHPILKFLLLFFGAGAFEQSCLRWSSQHRIHHRYVDTELDPYNIKKGFFYAHMGWLMFWKRRDDFSNAADLAKDPMIMHQHRYYGLWALTAGVLFPVILGFLVGRPLGAFVIAVCFRITFVYQGTFLINSACHMFGKSTYDIHASAKDSWYVALLSFGEGYHNFHHQFPGDYRNGVRWYAFDPSKWLIALFSKVGMTWDLKRVSRFRILSARLAGESQRMQEFLEERLHLPRFEKALHKFSLEYQKIKESLEHWEETVRTYRKIVAEGVKEHSTEFRKKALSDMKKAQQKFRKIHDQWITLVQLHPLELQKNLLTA